MVKKVNRMADRWKLLHGIFKQPGRPKAPKRNWFKKRK